MTAMMTNLARADAAEEGVDVAGAGCSAIKELCRSCQADLITSGAFNPLMASYGAIFSGSSGLSLSCMEDLIEGCGAVVSGMTAAELPNAINTLAGPIIAR